jgi:hypothetical protein
VEETTYQPITAQVAKILMSPFSISACGQSLENHGLPKRNPIIYHQRLGLTNYYALKLLNNFVMKGTHLIHLVI